MNLWHKLSIIHQARNKQNQLFGIILKLIFSPWEIYTDVSAAYFCPTEQRDVWHSQSLVTVKF